MDTQFRTFRVASILHCPEPQKSSAEGYLALDSVESWTGQLVNSPWRSSNGTGKEYKTRDLLFGKLRPYLAKVWVANKPGAYIGDFLHLRPGSSSDADYLSYVMRTPQFINESSASSYGSKMPRIEWEQFKNMRLPLPPLEEQRRISEFLDRETAEIDAFIADLQEFRSTLFERRSARRDALIAGGRPVQEAGYTWLSEFEAIYTEGRMKNIFEITLGKMLDAKSHRDNETHYPYLRAANISEGTVDFGELNQMPFNARERERFSIKKGDMLVVEGGSVGENTVIEQDLEDIFFQKTINRARPKYGNDSYYFSQVLGAYLDREVFDVVCNKSTIMHLTAEKLGDLEVPIPRPDTQQAISRDLMNLDAEVRLAVSDVEMAIALATERRSALIAAAVTGQLDVSDRYAAEKVFEEVESKQ